MARPILQPSISIHVEPDTSWLGEYTNSADMRDPRSIDREARGDMGRGEYPYFVAAMSPTTTGNPDSVEQDYRRMETLNQGQWGFVGIWAEAQILNPDTHTLQTVRSGGLWGIEDDSAKDYLQSVAKEELAALKAEMQALGIKTPRKLKAKTRTGYLDLEAEV